MPFRRSARIVLTNDAVKDVTLVFYDVDITLGEPPPDALYFHAYWHRERATTIGQDFRVLPRVQGRGRYLGATVGVVTAQAYGDTWWGEGELKVFLDGDAAHATLVGTGTEDAWVRAGDSAPRAPLPGRAHRRADDAALGLLPAARRRSDLFPVGVRGRAAADRRRAPRRRSLRCSRPASR